MEVIKYYVNVFIYQVSLLFDLSYYASLAKQYLSIKGFIVGFIFVVILTFTSFEEDKKFILSLIKTIGVFAFINAISVVNYIMAHVFDQVFIYNEAFQKLMVPANIISGGFMMLAAHTMDRKEDDGVRAFFFGVGVYLSLPMINYMLYFDTLTLPFKIMVIVEAFFAGVVTAITAVNKSFAKSWVVYFVFYIIMHIVSMGLALADTVNPITSTRLFLGNIKYYIMDISIFAIVFILSVIYDKLIVNYMPKKAKASVNNTASANSTIV